MSTRDKEKCSNIRWYMWNFSTRNRLYIRITLWWWWYAKCFHERKICIFLPTNKNNKTSMRSLKISNREHTHVSYIGEFYPLFYRTHKFVVEMEKFARLLRLACAADVLSRITSRVISVSFVFIVDHTPT